VSVSFPPPRRLGYVTLGVVDLADGIRFWAREAHLRVRYESEECAYLSGGAEHHWIVLEKAPTPGLRRLAYEVDSADELAEARRRLNAAGSETREAADRGITSAIDFLDPDGLPLRLYFGMAHISEPCRDNWVNYAELLHAGLSVSNVQRSFEFYNGLLGFLVSDWVEQMGVFLRAGNGFHHALVLLQRDQPRLEHICFQMHSFDGLMRARLISKGVTLKTDLIRHAPSNSVAIYINAVPEDVVAETCIWHDQIVAGWKPRTLVRSPWAANLWTPPPDLESW
jgi:2,3-dihydroxy-p-cumate/2,3-dihydroxybenzoate 3,4-dioxygenase